MVDMVVVVEVVIGTVDVSTVVDASIVVVVSGVPRVGTVTISVLVVVVTGITVAVVGMTID